MSTGDDIQIILFFLEHRGPSGTAWKDLTEAERESWRHAYQPYRPMIEAAPPRGDDAIGI